MRTPEKDRLDRRQELERVFSNRRFAEIAMDAMPPIDYDQLATKEFVRVELMALDAKVSLSMAALDVKLANQMRLTFLLHLASFGGLVAYISSVT